ncbi:MAG: hypothetical protein A2010_07680 [Nitrospirae bacterium GWD2_57_9]|nr:MAG: hypothetical protein A2010_07680 [Nitrospirae bacterium GWD2_57_9]OGW47366.1 MAG: hypothetical protein A2078_15035 [Nitrospirae bacterium GWC2_57_9]
MGSVDKFYSGLSDNLNLTVPALSERNCEPEKQKASRAKTQRKTVFLPFLTRLKATPAIFYSNKVTKLRKGMAS